ncbi:uncharacterized protein LOC132565427 [Ylistrum balloti]|uniref:uncharacterized protein LOC132565427 n=1 Tax=Ylistrum balloti TaxID=509963 RepID=UPI002905CBC5|nr:uncharacterized protein LOC132565427 [Ylistrum balloti]
MMRFIALLTLLVETCLAFPPFSRGSYTLKVSGERNGYDADATPSTDHTNSLSLGDVMMQTLANQGTNVVVSDRYEYTTNPSEGDWDVFRAGLVSPPSGLLQQCLSLSSTGMQQLLYCIKLLSNKDQLHQSNVQSKRGPLKLNPTGWKRKKRSTNDDMQRELENIRIQSMLNQLLEKRQNANPRFNPTGW